MLELGSVKLEWLGHASFRILAGGKAVYIDPYNIKNIDGKADVILVSHGHYDHAGIEDIRNLMKPDTVLIATADCQSLLLKGRIQATDFRISMPGAIFTLGFARIFAIPAYNTNKGFHKREEEFVGYVIEADGKRIYHAGDTDFIPEMRNMKGITAALLPVGGTYTMTAAEAARAAESIRPEIAVPMHYGSIVGSAQDAEKFRNALEGKVHVFVFSDRSGGSVQNS